jgi:hypothetical protein
MALVVTTSCGGDGRPSISATQDSVCDDVAQVACFNMYQCCSEGEIERFLGVSDPRSESECRDDVHTRCERQRATYAFSLANKHLRFDADLMNACLAALEAPDGTCASVGSMTPWTAACMQSAWVGTVETGGACDFGYECAQGNVCSASRVCTALPGDGMPCAIQGCATGLYCGAGTCHPLVARGGTCTATTQCDKDLYCDTAGTRTCVPLGNNGEACSGNNTCASKTCLPGTCSGSTATCFKSSDCSGHCGDANGFFCTTDSNCSTGTCSGTTTLCTSQATCTTPGSVCVFPVKCVQPTCDGSIVCAEAHTTVDYCTGALSSLPLLGNAQPGAPQ